MTRIAVDTHERVAPASASIGLQSARKDQVSHLNVPGDPSPSRVDKSDSSSSSDRDFLTAPNSPNGLMSTASHNGSSSGADGLFFSAREEPEMVASDQERVLRSPEHGDHSQADGPEVIKTNNDSIDLS